MKSWWSKYYLLQQHRNGIVRIEFTDGCGNRCFMWTREENLKKYPALYPAKVARKEVVEGEQIKIYQM